MPKMFTELTQGQTFSRSSEEGGLVDSAQRVYKVILLHPAEVFDPQFLTGTYVGSRHPYNINLVCFNFDAKFDGESRMVAFVTFYYKNYATWAASATGGQNDPKTISPDIRPANWSTDTSLMEMPADLWSPAGANGPWTVPMTPMKDRYDGITKMVPITTIRVDQYEHRDPMINSEHVGSINSLDIKMGGRTYPAHTLMLRGVSSKAHVETFRTTTFRGWIATYDLVYRLNKVKYTKGDGSQANDKESVIGWDRLQPLEGFYVKNDRLGDDEVDLYGLSLQHSDYKVLDTAPTPSGYTYAAGTGGKTTQGQKMRAMVGFPCPTGGWAQRPSASPIALNSDGTPRNLTATKQDGSPKYYPILVKYQVQPEIDMVSTLNLRLF